jgi:antitoxin PrlF
MKDNFYFKTRLRNKGQITVPAEIRSVLGAEEGDDLLFYSDEQGRVIVSRAQVISPEQAWFWTQRWQQMEREAQADLEQGRVHEFSDVDEVITFLENRPAETDAEN